MNFPNGLAPDARNDTTLSLLQKAAQLFSELAASPPVPAPFKATFFDGNAIPLTLPLVNGGSYDFFVDWGDGSPVDHIMAYNDPAATHPYANDNPYQISITGTMDQWSFGAVPASVNGLASIDSWGSIVWSAMLQTFFGCQNLAVIPSGGHFLSVQDWTQTFRDCSDLTTIPAIVFASSPLCNFSGIFLGATSLEVFNPVGVNNDISFENCNFDSAGLNHIFTNLATVTLGQTITVTGNPGEATCNKSIATNKGWTVIPAPASSKLLLNQSGNLLLNQGGVLLLNA